MTAKEEFNDRTEENQKHRGTNRPCGAVAWRGLESFAAGGSDEAQTLRARPLQTRTCQRFQGRRRSRDERDRRRRRAATQARIRRQASPRLAGGQNITALDWRDIHPTIQRSYFS